MDERVIALTDLTKQYGRFTAVDRICLTIRKGEIFGLLGPNGAGKSTTILMMLGLTEPTSGSVEICGIDSTRHPIEVKRKIGYLPEDVGFYDDMTGPENLIYTARLNGISDAEAKVRALELMEHVGLAGQMKKKTGKYSRGMRQRLGLADVLIKNPEIIILDEPTSGIDPAGVQEFIELIRQLSRKEGLTVLFSSHHLDQVQKVCDRVGLFNSGKLVREYISESLDKLERILKERFDNLLGDIYNFKREHISSIIEDKAIMDWEYIDNLPKEIDGFKLFINPKEPVKIINGSYIIIDYCDFSKESNFIIYYNVFRDEFFGEARLHRIPEVTYEYDCSELKDLESLLAKNLQSTLHKIRERI